MNNQSQIPFAAIFSTLLIFISFSSCAQVNPPNIVLIVVDDMRYDEWSGGGHPFLETPTIDKLASSGTSFSRAYHAVPLCSPNRASILTGQYPSRHGIIDNTSRNQASFMLDLFPKYLQEAGYKTAHVGKWHMGNSPEPRPGYDYWVSMEGQGKTYDPVIYEDGQLHTAEGYITDVFTEKALKFIDEVAGNPFFLYIGHKAIHPEAVQRDDGSIDLSVPKEFIPAKRHEGTYKNQKFPRKPSYSTDYTAEEDKPVIRNAFSIRQEVMDSDPAWEAALDLGVSDKTIQNRAEMMIAVDESLEAIVRSLEEHDINDNTVIIFTSDNGYFFGEHGFSLERRMPYEESVKSPLIINHPGINQVKSSSELALSIDLSATVMEIAGIEKPASIQGQSLIPLLQGNTEDWREAALIEYYSNENPFPWTAQLDYRVVVREKYKYIKWLRFNEAELYDLEKDPYEQVNLINDPAMQDILEDLKEDLRVLQMEALGIK